MNAIAGVLVARLLGPTDRGLLAIVLSAAGIVSVAAGLGSNVAFRTHFPKGDVNLSGYWRLSSRLLLFLLLPSSALLAVLSGHLIESRLLAPSVIALFVAFSLSNFVWFQSSEALSAAGHIRRAQGISAVGSLSLALSILLLAAAGQAQLQRVVGCYIGALVLQAFLTLPAQRRLSDGASPNGVATLLHDGPRLLGYHFGQDLVYRLDRYLLGVFSSAQAVGYYAVATTPAELVRLPINVVAQYTLFDSARGLMTRRTAVLRALSLTIVAGLTVTPLWFVAPKIIEFIFGASYLPSVGPFRLLLIAQVALIPYLIFSRTAVGSGKTWSASAVGVAGLLVMVTSAVFFMPRFSAVGAAYSAILSFSTMSLFSLLTIWRLRPPVTSARGEAGSDIAT